VQEQILIFGLGGIVEFLLPGLLITTLLPRGEVLTAWGVAAYLGNALAKSWGSVGLL